MDMQSSKAMHKIKQRCQIVSRLQTARTVTGPLQGKSFMKRNQKGWTWGLIAKKTGNGLGKRAGLQLT